MKLYTQIIKSLLTTDYLLADQSIAKLYLYPTLPMYVQ